MGESEHRKALLAQLELLDERRLRAAEHVCKFIKNDYQSFIKRK